MQQWCTRISLRVPRALTELSCWEFRVQGLTFLEGGGWETPFLIFDSAGAPKTYIFLVGREGARPFKSQRHIHSLFPFSPFSPFPSFPIFYPFLPSSLPFFTFSFFLCFSPFPPFPPSLAPFVLPFSLLLLSPFSSFFLLFPIFSFSHVSHFSLCSPFVFLLSPFYPVSPLFS